MDELLLHDIFQKLFEEVDSWEEDYIETKHIKYNKGKVYAKIGNQGDHSQDNLKFISNCKISFYYEDDEIPQPLRVEKNVSLHESWHLHNRKGNRQNLPHIIAASLCQASSDAITNLDKEIQK